MKSLDKKKLKELIKAKNILDNLEVPTENRMGIFVKDGHLIEWKTDKNSKVTILKNIKL